jgi:exodeoxyribonuclease V gamma subunit
VRAPVRAFLRQRLDISVADYTQEVKDALTVELDGLGQWEVGDRLLESLLRGSNADAAKRAELARGKLPPGRLGDPLVDDMLPMVAAIAATARDVRKDLPPPGSLDIRVTLPDGRVLGGTVPDVSGDLLSTVTYSRIRAKQRVVAWVQLLALSVAYPERPFAAVTIGRAMRGNRGWIAKLPPLGAEAALEHLIALIDLYDRAMREPPPLAVASSAAYAEAAFRGQDVVRAVGDEWQTRWGDAFDREDREPDHMLVHGRALSVEELLAEPVRDGEGWGYDDPTRFGCWARRLWTPLLEAEASA